ncbi:T9SS type B sorting domain-containing protein, partial [Salegentibacter maritimus]|uniref:T9SS type B sorting domain-containing protein n=1 Tax=Salegentibacter maritimus TaxID=2794347 RepID=UPI0018E47AE4
ATGCTEISFTTETIDTIPNCTTISSPVDGATEVSISENISWDAVPDADGYYVNIGTTVGGNDLVNNTELTTTTYSPTIDFPENTTIYVSVTPYNAIGNATGCTEISFTTETIDTIPNCTTISSPVDGATDVSISENITWDAVPNADGYYINIGTTAGGNDLVNNTDLTTITYSHTTDFPENTTIYVSVTPYNAIGNATGCAEISFTTETIATIPNCTSITSPLDGATEVSISENISWDAVPNADGYYVNIGTTPGGNDLVNNAELTTTNYSPTTDFPENTTIYVSVTPYNAIGNATGCPEISFTTETIATIPNCTTISSPVDGATDVSITENISWDAVPNADGYYVNIGTTPGGNDLVNNTELTTTSYSPATDFPENTTIYVSVTPYNAIGNATGCPEISFTTESFANPSVPDCTTITSPLDGATEVSISENISWDAVQDTDGYYINIGTNPGGNDLVNNTDLTTTSYTPTTDFPENTTIYVSVTPYNEVGNATGCKEISFTTETIATIPNCTTISSPVDGATDVSTNEDINWEAVQDADGYYINIGTTTGGNDLVNNAELTTTTYSPTTDFPENTTIYVSVTPYNVVGSATGCTEISFTTESFANPSIPNCSTITSPVDSATEVSISENISWDAVQDADGYYINIGTNPGGNDLVNNAELTTTTYSPTTDFPENTTIYVSVIPYNSIGSATACTEISFTTESFANPSVPDCTTITSPVDGTTEVSISENISWDAVQDADGYYINIGTNPGGNDLVNNTELTTTTSYSPTTDFPENTTIYVSVTPFNAIGNATGCTEISFTTETTNIIVSETKYGFSPNDDGINDYWVIGGIENHPNNIVSIYNRWGDIVFRIQGYNNQNNVFRGIANKSTKLGGSNLPSGTYFFTIENITKNHRLKKLKGFLVLKR